MFWGLSPNYIWGHRLYQQIPRVVKGHFPFGNAGRWLAGWTKKKLQKKA